MTYKRLLRNPFILYILLVLTVIVFDELIGVLIGQGTWNSFTLYDGSLVGLPTVNGLWNEIWFAETVAFICMPLLLWGFRKRLHIRLLPWTVVAIWMLFSVGVSLNDYMQTQFLDTPTAKTNLVYELHYGAEMYFAPGPGAFDPMLQSDLPYFLEAQALPWVLLGIGYVASKGFEKVKK